MKLPDGALVNGWDMKNRSGVKRYHCAKNDKLALVDSGVSEGGSGTKGGL